MERLLKASLGGIRDAYKALKDLSTKNYLYFLGLSSTLPDAFSVKLGGVVSILGGTYNGHTFVCVSEEYLHGLHPSTMIEQTKEVSYNVFETRYWVQLA